ncbi:MAG: flagellar basal body P-ring formation chaperone FlgA [Deltaproteobacteria bacterium]|jgi:flagella basal body P-ring formation protein FlgA|nr:flagellar basal body P-ring formation chaperone FlgA [Deltaproteobacteria bacterium]
MSNIKSTPRCGRSFSLYIGLCLSILLLSTGPALAGVAVIFPSQITVQSPRIILGDIANVASDTLEDETLANILSAIDLGESPAPGQELTLRRQQLETKLLSSGAPVNDARWQIPETLTITGGGQKTEADYIRKIIDEYLSNTEPYSSGRYEILSVRSPSPPALPNGTVSYRFAPQPSSNPTYLSGTIFFSVNGQESSRLRVTVQLELELPALVAARDLPRGHILAEEDMAESYTAFSRAKGALTLSQQAVGQTLKVSIRAGSPIHDRDLVQTAMVNKGETVTIIAQSGGLKVTALGQAKENGALGQTISVINQDSKKTISAKVIGPGQVEVVF